MNNQLLVNNIKKLCKDRNVSISTLEKDLFMSPGLISRWAKTTPALDRVVEIANYFHVSVDSLVDTMKESTYSNPKLKQLLYMLYSKSDSEDLMWSVFDRCHADSNKNTKFLLSLANRHNIDCFYCKFLEGIFIVTIQYSNIEDNKISLYAVADPNATPELLCDKGEPLFKLCSFLLKRYSRELNTIKTNNFLDRFLNQGDDESSYNDFNIFQFTTAANE